MLRKISVILIHDLLNRESSDESNTNLKFVIKTAYRHHLNNERQLLKRYRGHQAIRQLVDESLDPPTLVLQYLDTDILDASKEVALKPSEIKYVAKDVLSALVAMHDDGFVHTGMSRYMATVPCGLDQEKSMTNQHGDCRHQAGQHFSQSWHQWSSILQGAAG